MLALVIVVRELGANASLGLGNARMGIKINLVVFEASPQSLDKELMQRPLPSTLIVMPWRFREHERGWCPETKGAQQTVCLSKLFEGADFVESAGHLVAGKAAGSGQLFVKFG